MKAPQSIGMDEFSNLRLLEALCTPGVFMPAKSEQTWWEIMKILPQNLKSALIHELQLGNQVISIQYGDWPQKGSIVIALAFAFKADYAKRNSFGVTYRSLNDPHYWIEDIHQITNGVEHLIIH